MPRFPVYQRQQGLGGGATASYASQGPAVAMGNAVADLGNTVSGIGDQLAEREEKIRNSQEDTWFSKARADTTLEMQRIETEMQQAATDGAEGFTDQMRGRYEEVRQKYLGSAPSDRAKAMYDQWSYSYTPSVVGNAAKFQAGSTLAKRDSDFASAMLSHSKTVLGDPSTYDAVRARAMDDLEGAKQWMTPEQEIKARNAVERELQLARAKAEIQRDPSAFLKDIGVSHETAIEDAQAGAVSLLREFEGFRSGTYWDVNAHRLGYGTDTITAADGSVRKVRQGDKVSRADAERDLARRVGEFENTAVGQVGVDAWAALPANARAALISVTYNYGSLPKSVVNAVKGGDVEAIASAVGGLSANKSRRQKEAAVIRGGAIPSSPNVAGDERFSSLDVDDVISLQEEAQNSYNAMQRDAKAALTSQMAQMKGAFQLGIATGDAGVTRQSILDSPLPDDDKAQLINSLNSKRGDAMLAEDAIRRIDMGASFDAYDSDDRKAVNLAYEQVTGGGSLYAEDSNAGAALGYMFSRSGIVPKAAVNEIRAGLLSDKPKEVAAAASYASQLVGIDRGGVEAAENSEALLKAATTFDHMRDTLGLTMEQAGQRMIDMHDPEKQRQRTALLETKAVKDRIKNIDAAEVRDIFDPGVIGFDPELGDNPMAEASMVADYKAMYEESIVEANGDEELAEEYAAQRFRRLYSPSGLTLSGSGVVTRLPPENTYPPAKDGTHTYIADQAREALAASGIETDSVFFQYYPGTEDDFKAGKPARYLVYYAKGGDLEMFQFPFFADPKKATTDYSANRARRDVNRDQEQNRQAIINGPDDGTGFDSLHFPGGVDAVRP